jgi:CO dehydrogenase/acetyl-CoA synthase alpha subunit
MTHEDTEAIAALDALGVAAAGDLAALAAHIACCIPCRRARDEYRRAVTFLAMGLEPVAPPYALRERAAAAL